MQNTLFSFDSSIFPEYHFLKNCTELGRIYDIIPWQELGHLLPSKKNPAGAPSYLARQGYFGLMFLKHYTGLSDEKLLAAFQTNWAYQMFCGCRLKVGEVIRNNAFVSRIRSFLARHCDMQKVQAVLINAWKGKMENTNVVLMDETHNGVGVIRFICVFLLMSNSCGSHAVFCGKNKFRH